MTHLSSSHQPTDILTIERPRASRRVDAISHYLLFPGYYKWYQVRLIIPRVLLPYRWGVIISSNVWYYNVPECVNSFYLVMKYLAKLDNKTENNPFRNILRYSKTVDLSYVMNKVNIHWTDARDYGYSIGMSASHC